MAIVVVNFSLDGERDQDILDWLDSQPRRRRSAAIRAAIRTLIARGDDPTLADIMAEIRALPSRMPVAVAIESNGDAPDTQTAEPEEAAANLDGFLDRQSDFD